MHGHQGWNVRHGLCHIYMIYVYIWVVYSFCLFCCLFIIVTTQFVALYKPCKPKPNICVTRPQWVKVPIKRCVNLRCNCIFSVAWHYQQATGLDAWASRVKCPARFVSYLHDICIYIWVVYSFCLFCCLFIIVTTQFVALYKPCKPKPNICVTRPQWVKVPIKRCVNLRCNCIFSVAWHYQQATGLDAWASRVKCPARFVSHLHDICIYVSCL